MRQKNFLKPTARFKGFSLVELLVSVSIIGVLSSISVVSYRKYVRGAYKTAAKVELSDVKKALNYTHSVDGGYHDRIHSAGYRLPESMKSWGGFPVSAGNIKCGIFPTKSGINSQHSRYFTLTKNAYSKTALDGAQNSREICDRDSDCDTGVVGGNDFTFIKMIPQFNSLAGSPSGSCSPIVKTSTNAYKYDCNSYNYAVISKIPRRHFFLATDQTGKICAGEEKIGWKLEK